MPTFEHHLASYLSNHTNATPCDDHAPVPCVFDPSNVSLCLVAQLHSRWTSESRPFHQTELPFSLSGKRAMTDTKRNGSQAILATG